MGPAWLEARQKSPMGRKLFFCALALHSCVQQVVTDRWPPTASTMISLERAPSPRDRPLSQQHVTVALQSTESRALQYHVAVLIGTPPQAAERFF